LTSTRGPFSIRVERLDHEILILDGLALARGFFAGDEASAPGVLGSPDRIELADVIAMNSTMRSRSPHRVWADVVDVQAPWLAAIPTDLDLLETGDRTWTRARGDELVAGALAATIGPGRGLAVATKLLHLKRPRLFPMLDRLVAEMLGLSLTDDPRPAQRVEAAVRLTRTIRTEGRRNLEPLRAVRDALSADGTSRSLVRILDAILWFAHPAARIAGASRTIEVRLRRE
jgi:Family of unknown function (DUF6308)